MSEFKQAFTEVVFTDDKQKEEIDEQMINLFLGLDKKKHEELITAYNLVSEIKKAYENKDEKSYEILREKLIEVRDNTFPDISIEQLSENSVNYRTFILRFFNLNYAKHLSDVNSFGPFSNSFQTLYEGGAEEYKFIKPIPIETDHPDLSKADRMRRRHRSSALQTSDTIAVTLPNSFIYTAIRRPTRLEQAALINRIEKELKYFGERWAISGLSLERAGIARILVEFYIELIMHHTVEDVMTKEELMTVILYNDIDAIAMGLLEAGAPKGVYYHLTCLANSCNYSTIRKYQPSELFLTLDDTFSEEQSAFISALPTAGRKFKVEEIKALQNQYRRNGEVIDTSIKLYPEDDDAHPYGEFNLGIPTLSEYFTTFEFMASIYNDAIQKYTLDYSNDPAKLYRKRSELIGATRMGNYLHWIKNYITYSIPGKENSKTIVDDRSGDEQRQFEEGLLYIFSDDDRAYEDTIKKLHATVPFMTHTVTGIYESQCPGCKKKAGEAKDKEGNEIPVQDIAKQSGFTPIDPVTNFFDHTRMKIASLGVEQQSEEVNIF